MSEPQKNQIRLLAEAFKRRMLEELGPEKLAIAVSVNQALRKAVEGLPKNEHNREVARIVEAAVRRMAPPGPNRVMSARLASDVDG